MTGDEVAEVIAAAAVAAFAHHRVQPAGGQRRELLQGLMDEGQIGLDLRATCRRPDPGQTGLGQDPRHGAVVHMQLAGDRANAPFLDMIYPVHVMTRKSFGLMTRKLSVTESQKSAQFRGTVSRRKPSVASANWAHVA